MAAGCPGPRSALALAVAAGILSPLPSAAQQLIYERRVFPQANPLVCVTLISHHRFDLLERTMKAAMRHFERDEPDWLTYELAWFDNGSGEPAREFEKRVQVERKELSEHNLGLPAAINALVRRLCTAPYLLTLEEDWEYGGDGAAGADWIPSPGAPAFKLLDTPARRVAVASAAGLLAAEAAEPEGLAVVGEGLRRRILGVTLRGETLDMRVREPRRSPWTTRAVLAPPEAGETGKFWSKSVEYRTYCLDWNSGQVFAAYTNGAALYNRSRLVSLGPMYGDPQGVPNSNGARIFYDANVQVGGRFFPSNYGETNYAVRAGMQYCSATLRLEPGCEGVEDVTGGTCSAAFIHTGHGRGYGLEKRNAAKVDADRDEIWKFAGTPLLDAALSFRRMVELESSQQALAGFNAAVSAGMSSELVRAAVNSEGLARLGGWREHAATCTDTDGAVGTDSTPPHPPLRTETV